MRKYFASIIVAVVVLLCAFNADAAKQFQNETLKYDISYKWGAVQKVVGNATLNLKLVDGQYRISLTGRTQSWMDKYYTVRDTLRSVIDIDTFRPLSYTRIAHEGDGYARDDLKYSYSGSTIKADVKRARQKKGESLKRDNASFSVNSEAYDMLSVFYFIRTINFDKLKQGGTVTRNMFSGSMVESITIRYVKVGMVDLPGGKSKPAFQIKFKFTREGKKKSSDDIDAWISADSRHIPYIIEGNLPIGKIRCVCTNP